MYINVTVRRICVTLEGKKYYILWVYVSVNLGIRHAESLRHITICGLSGSTIFFTHYLTNGTIFEEKKLLDMKSVFLFYVQNLSETFLILRRIQWNHIINVLGLHVKYSLFLSDFNETWIFLTNFKKYLNIKFHENPSNGSPVISMTTDRRTDMREVAVASHSSWNSWYLSVQNIHCHRVTTQLQLINIIIIFFLPLDI